ncbi:MAG TPA: hypothetical protein VN922_04305 [Bacteroidia bacterium]|nr:hypothetical protein [Bacteroidia bacterium]
MKYFSKIVFAALIMLGLASCMKKANYSIIPAITFKSLVINSTTNATLQVNFTDGDGDIGYQTSDVTAPVNFYVELLQQDSTGKFQPILDPLLHDTIMSDTAFLGYHIPYITPTGNDKELSGQIQVVMSNSSWYFASFKNMEYKVWLIDRSGHVSNRITTPTIVSP